MSGAQLTPRQRTRRRWVFRGISSVVAIAVGMGTSAFLPVWVAGGVALGIGLLATSAWEKWDDRDTPDFVQTFEDGLK